MSGEPLIELEPVPIIYVSGLHTCEDIGGGCYLLTCFLRRKSLITSRTERHVALRFAAPIDAIPPALCAVASAVGMRYLGGGFMSPPTVPLH